MQAFFCKRQITKRSLSREGTSQTDRSIISVVNLVRYMST